MKSVAGAGVVITGAGSGIGFTWEHPAHLYLKRAKSASIGFGTPDLHRASLAWLADLPAPPASAAGPGGPAGPPPGGSR